ncbi:MAG: DUF2461 domain-containing protein [Bacteroidales bacterium]|jgi:uncharacterized protein (TIGR02453 family)|nr:DUF2461 domain-containing protein [Bacteroidales bacterium]
MEIKIILDFLSELKNNNNRDWFQLNKDKYEEAKLAMIGLLQNLIDEAPNFDHDVGHLEPKDCLFRIYRDVRFSKNKDPYKINMGGFIAKGGRKSGNAGYYIHLEPDNSFVGGGIYNPGPKKLKAIREEIDYAGEELISITVARNFKRHFSKIEGDSLVRPPKNFDPNSKYIDILKMKSFTVFKKLDDTILARENFVDHLIPVLKSMKPFNAFLNRAFTK